MTLKLQDMRLCHSARISLSTAPMTKAERCCLWHSSQKSWMSDVSAAPSWLKWNLRPHARWLLPLAFFVCIFYRNIIVFVNHRSVLESCASCFLAAERSSSDVNGGFETVIGKNMRSGRSKRYYRGKGGSSGASSRTTQGRWKTLLKSKGRWMTQTMIFNTRLFRKARMERSEQSGDLPGQWFVRVGILASQNDHKIKSSSELIHSHILYLWKN